MNEENELQREVTRLRKLVDDLIAQHQCDMAEIVRLRRLCEVLEEGGSRK